MSANRPLHLVIAGSCLLVPSALAGGGGGSGHSPAAPQHAAPMSAHRPGPAPTTPTAPSADQALQNLRVGNTRFFSNARTAPNVTPQRIRETAEKGQNPFVTILSCADSRVPLEHIFDAGIGDLFVVRVAGNVADTDEVGTIEYGVGHLHTPLLVVMGHTACGAVKAVAEGAEVHGSIPGLVDNIIPAVEFVKRNRPELTGHDLINAAVEANVWQSIDDVISGSEEVRGLLTKGSLKIVGAVYDIATGKVRFMGEHPYQERILSLATFEKPGAEERAMHVPPPRQAEEMIGNAPAHAEAHDDDHGAAPARTPAPAPAHAPAPAPAGNPKPHH